MPAVTTDQPNRSDCLVAVDVRTHSKVTQEMMCSSNNFNAEIEKLCLLHGFKNYIIPVVQRT
jgi:hypothetical protein